MVYKPIFAEVDMEFYHSLPSVQVLLGEMTRLESVAMSLKASTIINTGTTITTTNTTATPISTTVNCTEKDICLKEPRIEASKADRPQPKNRTEKATTSTPANNKNNNNNNKTNNNQEKADDNHIPEPSDYLLEQQKAAAEVERWEKKRLEESES